MNVTLPETKAIKKKQWIIYISIICVCIICVIVAFYVEFYARIGIASLVGLNSGNTFGQKTEEEEELLKSEFNQVFTNSIENDNGENDSKKAEAEQSLVYTSYEKKESKVNSYDIEVYIPHINVQGDIVDGYNKKIDEIFLTTVENILATENRNIICTIDYAAYVHDGILSLMIRSNLKEGANAQKVIIQTYNYDLRNNKEITLEEVLRVKQLNVEEVQTKVNDEIANEQKKAEDLKSLGYNIYSRDTSSDIYSIENSTEFYLTDNVLYIVYAYGNQTSTSEMDIIIL